jgi:hypothetical protein
MGDGALYIAHPRAGSADAARKFSRNAFRS